MHGIHLRRLSQRSAVSCLCIFVGDKNFGSTAPEQALYQVKKVIQAVYSSRQNVYQTVIY